MNILDKKVLGKEMRTWVHYPIILAILIGFYYLIGINTYSSLGLIIGALVVLIISDLAVEKVLEVK